VVTIEMLVKLEDMSLLGKLVFSDMDDEKSYAHR
jgi:hypothetical protein